MSQRNVGWLEGSFIASNLTIIAVASLEGESSILNESSLLRSCLTVQSRHPNLRLNCDCDPRSKLARLFTVDRPVQLTSVSIESREFNQHLHELQNRSLPIGSETDVLWSVHNIVLTDTRSTKLCIAMHHGITDGTSAYIIINDILQSYNMTNTNHIAESLPFLPDIESLCFNNKDSYSNSSSAADAILTDLISRRSVWKPTLPTEIPQNNNHDDRVPNDFLLRATSSASFLAIQQRCRDERITIGSLLLASLHFAVVKLLRTRGESLQFPWRFEHDMDVNLRKRIDMNLKDDHVGLLIGMMSVNVPVESVNDPFFEFARRITNWTKESVARRDSHSYHIANRRYDEQIGAPVDRVTDLNFSNVGLYPFETKFNGFRLTSIHEIGWWCPAVGTHVFLISTCADRICYSWVFEQSPGNQAVANELLDQIQHLIEQTPTLPAQFCINDLG